MIKNRRSAFRIVTRNDFACGLVINKYTRNIILANARSAHCSTVHANDIGREDALADMSGLPVHRDSALGNALFHIPAGTDTRVSEYFLNFFALHIRGH